MTRTQQVPLAAEILVAVTIHQNQHAPDVAAADAAQHQVRAATIHRHRCQHLLRHADQIPDNERIGKLITTAAALTMTKKKKTNNRTENHRNHHENDRRLIYQRQ